MAKAFGAALALTFLAAILFPGAVAATEPERATGRVVKIFDGDTALVTIDGHDEKVRLLGIDAPETDTPYTSLEPLGIEAKERLTALALGKRVELIFGGETRRDKFGRLLAHLILPDGSCLNEIMLTEGYAKLFRRFSYTRKERYWALEQEARKAKRGVWGLHKERVSPTAP